MKVETHTQKWDESYVRYENSSNYPKEEIVKFLNRFIRKRKGENDYSDLIDFEGGVKGFDFGCGNGRMTALLDEFGLNAYGVDISGEAISQAKNLFPDLAESFSIINGDVIPFSNKFFDVSICEGVLDSMHLELAKKLFAELDRVTKKYLYISLISGDNSNYYREFAGEEIVDTGHEYGTVQTYFNWCKVKELIAGSEFNIVFAELMSRESMIYNYKRSRYSIVLKKE